MKALLFFVAVSAAGLAWAQTCVVPAPPVPPRATEGTVRFPNPDGGARPCFLIATVPGGAPAREYQLGSAACDGVKVRVDQAAAKDNGWDDGGSP